MTYFQGRHDDEQKHCTDFDHSERDEFYDGRFGREHYERSQQAVRDERGRFIGCGNPRGRPRKVKLPPPTSLSAALALALEKEVAIRMDGKLRTVPVYEAIATRLVHAMLSSTDVRATTQMLRQIDKMGAFDLLDAVQDYKNELLERSSEPGWTPELEAKFRIVEASFTGMGDDCYEAGEPSGR